LINHQSCLITVVDPLAFSYVGTSLSCFTSVFLTDGIVAIFLNCLVTGSNIFLVFNSILVDGAERAVVGF
jgi:hypothetical protein